MRITHIQSWCRYNS